MDPCKDYSWRIVEANNHGSVPFCCLEGATVSRRLVRLKVMTRTVVMAAAMSGTVGERA